MNLDELFINSHKLPQPLSKAELSNLIQEAQKGSEEAMEQIVLHNIRLVIHQVTNKFKNADYDKKDLVSIGNIGLLKAIKTYDFTRGFEFVTYASRCIDNEILMFLRKIKDDNNIDSLDRTIYQSPDGSELKLEDKISDDSNIVEDYEKLELHKIIRNLVKQLPKRDMEIVMLYFGFYNDKVYTQQEIADKLGVTRSYISRLITKIVEELGEKLEKLGVIELQSKQNKNGKENKKMPKLKTIYEQFNEYTREQVDEMLKKITEEEKKLIILRYGNDLDHPVPTKLSQQEAGRFYSILIPKMRRLLANPNNEHKRRGRKPKNDTSIETVTTDLKNDNMTKDDCIKLLELLRTPTFGEMMNILTVKEVVIIALRLGYVDGKYFSTKSISEFLQIEEEEIREITQKILLVYKENINAFLGDIIAIATSQDDQENQPVMKKTKNIQN